MIALGSKLPADHGDFRRLKEVQIAYHMSTLKTKKAMEKIPSLN